MSEADTDRLREFNDTTYNLRARTFDWLADKALEHQR